MLWSTLIAAVQTEVGDVGGVFHDDTDVRRYLDQAELFINMHRILVEKTETLTFDGRPLYVLHDFFPDFITPLRISIDGVSIDPDTLATLSCLDPNWYETEGKPETWFVVGATLLGFHEIPVEGEAEITYLAVPSTAGTAPTIAETWHQALVHFGNAIALAKESQYPRAEDHLGQFLTLMSIERDKRILSESSQKPAKARSEIVWRSND